jgi:hypothetical protein
MIVPGLVRNGAVRSCFCFGITVSTFDFLETCRYCCVFHVGRAFSVLLTSLRVYTSNVTSCSGVDFFCDLLLFSAGSHTAFFHYQLPYNI